MTIPAFLPSSHLPVLLLATALSCLSHHPLVAVVLVVTGVDFLEQVAVADVQGHLRQVLRVLEEGVAALPGVVQQLLHREVAGIFAERIEQHHVYAE